MNYITEHIVPSGEFIVPIDFDWVLDYINSRLLPYFTSSHYSPVQIRKVLAIKVKESMKKAGIILD